MDIGFELSRLLGPLRRTVLRAARADAALPDLPESSIELLREIEARGRSQPSDLAEGLGLAPSTISNLLKALTESGLITRETVASDRRSAVVSLTERSRQLLERYDQTSSQLINAATGALPESDQRALAAAMPALRRLLDILPKTQPDGPPGLA
ncbi:transcriptional regulator, MarR family [Segniliparus rotundus DSM 44985]|uniref:Transcriptional regulator, MarR family n=1 Tax=Segniliparus rotundus (strain ATCC BAA-972 / CDC 1076 / CIP 108378 / DSM 44985 / JCM 13578) TaxID=640132 RepID=D6ZDU3_SEGRD|nr:MarR family winged helix-turn-helix transcriptional regulator [Segniliparus rotundus]ADG99350.1 transcriptional regulator, MarR family [Segniliparus rotundus DSM 44985]